VQTNVHLANNDCTPFAKQELYSGIGKSEAVCFDAKIASFRLFLDQSYKIHGVKECTVVYVWYTYKIETKLQNSKFLGEQ